MSWFSSVVIAVLTAIFSAVVGGLIAARAVVWYRVSSFEGGSGYFTVSVALGAMIAGLLVGLVMARVIAAGASPSFVKALGLSWVIVAVLGGLSAATSRALADIPPTIAGEELMLMVEVRWPKSQTTSPASDTILRRIDLGMLSGNSVRTSKQGPLWTEDAHEEEGRWITPGAVELFSARGKRVVSVEPAIANANALVLPMPASPTEANFAWSEWLPRAGDVPSSNPNAFSYRFKVVPRSQPSRIETIGPFEIGTVASAYFVGNIIDGQYVMTGTATFNVRFGDQRLFTNASSVATLPGTPTALLVQGSAPNIQAGCLLVQDPGVVTGVANCGSLMRAEPFTNDDAWRAAAKLLPVVQGRVDRTTFMHEGEYLFTDAIFDTKTRTTRPSGPTTYQMGFNSSVEPFGISPSGHNYARLGFAENQGDTPALLIFNTDWQPPYLVPIDRTKMRYPGYVGVNSTWMLNYYEWKQAPDGRETLELRPNATPLPNRGVMHAESDGALVYDISGTDARMVRALGDFLVSEFHAVRAPDDTVPDHFSGHIENVKVTVFANETSKSTALFLERGSNSDLVQRVSTAFNKLLATGKYDALFTY